MTTDTSGVPGVPPGRNADDFVSDLYRSHALALIRTALLLVGERAVAEDVVQEAFLGLYRALPRLRDPGRAVPYLKVSVLNGCRSVLRSRKRAWFLRSYHDPPAWSAEAAALHSEDQREALAAVARLPHRQREVLTLRYFLSLTDHEIAGLLRISRGTVSSTASRALATLARELGENS